MNIKKSLKLVVLAAVESRWLVVKSKLVGAEVVGSDRNLFKGSHDHVFCYITKLECQVKSKDSPAAAR